MYSLKCCSRGAPNLADGRRGAACPIELPPLKTAKTLYHVRFSILNNFTSVLYSRLRTSGSYWRLNVCNAKYFAIRTGVCFGLRYAKYFAFVDVLFIANPASAVVHIGSHPPPFDRTSLMKSP